jgi:putative transposase
MPRGPRYTYPNATHHVMARTNDRRKMFVNEDDRFLFIELMRATREKYGIEWEMFTQMTTHFHAKVRTPRPNISLAMQWLLSRYAELWNARHRRRGSLMEGRFRSPLVEDGRYALTVIRYIALNPVEADYVKHADEWRWASHRALAGLESPPDFLSMDWLRTYFDGPSLSDCRKQYRRFVDETAREPIEIVDRVATGSPAFETEVRELIGRKMRAIIVPRSYRALARPPLGKLFADVQDPEGRDEMILRAQVVHGYTQAEIARSQALHPNTISKITRRVRRQRFYVVRTS